MGRGALIPRDPGTVAHLGAPEDGPAAWPVSEAWPTAGSGWVSRMAMHHVGRPGPDWSQQLLPRPAECWAFRSPRPVFGVRLKLQAMCTCL